MPRTPTLPYRRAVDVLCDVNAHLHRLAQELHEVGRHVLHVVHLRIVEHRGKRRLLNRLCACVR